MTTQPSPPRPTTAPGLPGPTAIPPAAPTFTAPAAEPGQAAPPAGSPSDREAPAPSRIRPFAFPARPTRSIPPAGAGDSPPRPQSAPDDPLHADASGATHSQADELAKLELNKQLIKELGRGLVLTVTEIVHEMAARSEPARNAELWLSNDAEQRAIGDPLASIALRHSGGVPGSPDVVDLVKAGIGVLAYGVRNARTSIKLRRDARRARTFVLEQAEPAKEAA